MTNLQKRSRVVLTIISIFLFQALSIQSVFGAPKRESVNNDIFLPIVKNGDRAQTVFGMEIINPSNTTIMQKAEDTGAYWVRYLAFNWAEIESVRGTYNWNAIDETALQNIKNKNLKTIGIIYHTPTWAQKISGKTCGPIAQEDLAAFSQFVKALVTRYGFSSYSIKYWEFMNEPDAAWSVLPDDSQYGCWGDSSDLDYYGGDYYAEMLKVAYPAVKSVDPNAQVVLGGLLIDCDPTNQPVGGSCPQGKFFEGILSNAGGNFIDIVNYHAYPYQSNGKIYDEIHPGWKNRGGIVQGKEDFLQEVMQNHGISKPIMLSEAALSCPEWSDCIYDLPAFYENQADYVLRLYSSSQTIGLLGSIWYQLEGPGWRYCGLLYGDKTPKPAYNAYQFMTQEMRGTTALGESADYTGVTTHKFSSPEKQIWIMWASDQLNKSVSLPSNTSRVLDKYGNVLYTNPVPNPITINRPIYVELPK